jgi:hypothetical protein
MSYPPQDPYSPGAAPVPDPSQPVEGQQHPTVPIPGTPVAPAGPDFAAPAAPVPPGFAAPAAPVAYEQGFAAAGYAAPVSAPPPYSGVPGAVPPPFSGPPMSGPPMSGPPHGYVAPPPAATGRPTVLILGIVAALLFALGGAMTGLFVATNNELNTTRTDLTAQVEERDETISSKEDELGRLQEELQKTKDELDATNQTLTGTQNDRDRVEKEKAAIANCLNLVNQFFAAAALGQNAEMRKLQPKVDKACTEAQKYL